MEHCRSCWAELAYGAKFCQKCGQPTNNWVEENNRRQREEAERKAAEERAKNQAVEAERRAAEEKAKKQAEEAARKQKELEEMLDELEEEKSFAAENSGEKSKKHKCPGCGELLPSLAVNCPACGYEVKQAALSSIKDLHRQLRRADTVEKRDFTIRNFPIPNSKEDIIEFMILASTNIIGEDETDIYEAWLAKFEQAYQKALIVFDEASDLEKIKKIHDSFKKNVNSRRLLKIKKFPSKVIKFVKQNPWISLFLLVLLVLLFMGFAENNNAYFIWFFVVSLGGGLVHLIKSTI